MYVDNVTSAVRQAELKAVAFRRQFFTNDEPAFFSFLSNVAEPAVCLFGIAGNILNILILTRKQLQRSAFHFFLVIKFRYKIYFRLLTLKEIIMSIRAVNFIKIGQNNWFSLIS